MCGVDTHSCPVDEDVQEVHEDPARLFGVGVFVQLSIQVAELERAEGGGESQGANPHSTSRIIIWLLDPSPTARDSIAMPVRIDFRKL